ISESPNKSENENVRITKYEKAIHETIEFVNNVIRKEQLTDTKKA
ncbi:29268_t:CDS:1, partial [Racocetra persica]